MSRPLSERMVTLLRAVAEGRAYVDHEAHGATYIDGEPGWHTPQATALLRRGLVRLGERPHWGQACWQLTAAGRRVLADLDAATPRSAPHVEQLGERPPPIQSVHTAGGLL